MALHQAPSIFQQIALCYSWRIIETDRIFSSFQISYFARFQSAFLFVNTGNLCIIIMVGLVVCIGRGANDGDEDKTLAEAYNAPNDDGHPDNYADDHPHLEENYTSYGKTHC